MLAERINDPLPTILNDWTLEQALDAHQALDYLDALAEEATESARQKSIR